ncbi:MAG: AMP-binding protein [Rhodospirillaceae bacterium]|nr:AMP-binding protein [Rhodospirillaceae bacterium]
MRSSPSTLSALLASTSRSDIAIRYGEERIRYGDLADHGAALAGGLARLGLGAGDRIAIWLPNVPAWLELLFAAGRLGAVAVAVNTRFRAVEIADIVHRSRARALAVWPGFRGIDFLGILESVDPEALARLETLILYDEGEAVPALPGRLQAKRLVRYAELIAAAGPAPDAGSPQAGAAIFTTSGTTKAPKFVLHSQRRLVDHARDVATAFGFAAPDATMMQALPFCGVFGLSQALATVAASRPMVLMPTFDAEAAAPLIRDQRVTHMNGTDAMFRQLLDAASEPQPFPSLRRAGFAAFGGDPDALVALGDRRGVSFAGLYGMSELQALYACQSPSAPATQRARAGGVPVSPLAKVRVRDPATGAILPEGQAGEIEAAGPSLMAGYADDPAATSAAFTPDGFLRTGDLGYATRDGFVFLARMGDALRLGGFLVNPSEIEAHLDAHPAVAASQVVGARTPRGDSAVAFVIKRAAAETTEADLVAHCRAGLAAFKCPAAIVFLDAFPVTESANGIKIQRTKLRDWALERLGV